MFIPDFGWAAAHPNLINPGVKELPQITEYVTFQVKTTETVDSGTTISDKLGVKLKRSPWSDISRL